MRDTFEVPISRAFGFARDERKWLRTRAIDLTGGREREISEGMLRRGNARWLSGGLHGHSLGWAPESTQPKSKPQANRVDRFGIPYGRGGCSQCGKPIDTTWTKCSACLEPRRLKAAATRERRRQLGICTRCGREDARPGIDTCERCRQSSGTRDGRRQRESRDVLERRRRMGWRDDS